MKIEVRHFHRKLFSDPFLCVGDEDRKERSCLLNEACSSSPAKALNKLIVDQIIPISPLLVSVVLFDLCQLRI